MAKLPWYMKTISTNNEKWVIKINPIWFYYQRLKKYLNDMGRDK